MAATSSPYPARREKYQQGQLARRLPYFLITGSSQELLETEVKPRVEPFVQERGLELSEEKTTITHIKDGFEFLGQQIRQYKDKILVKPSRKRVHTLLTKVRALSNSPYAAKGTD